MQIHVGLYKEAGMWGTNKVQVSLIFYQNKIFCKQMDIKNVEN